MRDQYHTAFWQGVRRGVIWGTVLSYPPYAAVMIWGYLR